MPVTLPTLWIQISRPGPCGLACQRPCDDVRCFLIWPNCEAAKDTAGPCLFASKPVISRSRKSLRTRRVAVFVPVSTNPSSSPPSSKLRGHCQRCSAMKSIKNQSLPQYLDVERAHGGEWQHWRLRLLVVDAVRSITTFAVKQAEN